VSSLFSKKGKKLAIILDGDFNPYNSVGLNLLARKYYFPFHDDDEDDDDYYYYNKRHYITKYCYILYINDHINKKRCVRMHVKLHEFTTDSMELNSSWKAISRLAGQEFLWYL
jgi:hypothetical protein